MLKKLFDKYNALSVQMKATIWFFVCAVLQRGISVVTTPILTRLFTTTEYGRFDVFNSWLSIISIIVTLQLSAGVYTMGIVKFRTEEKIFTSSMQGLNLMLCLGWTVVYLVFHDFWDTILMTSTVQMLAMLLMIWSTAAFHFWMTTQRNRYRYRLLVVVTLLVSLAKPVMEILFILNARDKVTACILGLATAEVLGYLWFFFIQMHHGKCFYSAKYWKYAVLFNLPLIPHYLSSSILAGSDRIMIQRICGTAEAGIYGLAYSASQIMMLVNDSLNKTMSPWLYQKIRDKEYSAMSGVVYSSLFIIAGANLLLIAAAPELVAFFAPKPYYDAIYVIPPVAMGVYMQYLYLCFAPFEFYFEKRIWTTIGTMVSAAVNLVLNYFFIQKFGYYAAGYTTLACYMINAGMHYYFMRKICRQYLDDVKPFDLKKLMLITGIFLAVGFMYIPMYSNRIVRYGFTVLLVLIIQWRKDRIIPAMKKMLGKESGRR